MGTATNSRNGERHRDLYCSTIQWEEPVDASSAGYYLVIAGIVVLPSSKATSAKEGEADVPLRIFWGCCLVGQCRAVCARMLHIW